MKKTRFTQRAVMVATILAGGITLTSSPFQAKAMYSGETHSCVTQQDTPTHKTVDCVGVGTACTTVSTC